MIKTSLNILIITSVILLLPCPVNGQSYTDYKSMVQKMSNLSREYPSLCSVRSLVKTAAGKDIFVITIGKGDLESKPAIAIFGGVEGSHILGKELALGFAEKLLLNTGSDEIMDLLDNISFYIFPDISPDATEQYFMVPKYERNVNSRRTDNDRDFINNEDPYEDLNNDGLITQIRVSDPTGTYIENADDARVMTKGDLSKGQKGSFLVFSEGTDNDNDGSFNEDGEGGVNFNRNLTYNYEEFGLNAGLHPVSEPETRAVLDFLYSHFNIYSTIAFGPQDNLGKPMKAPEKPSEERKLTAITKADEKINRLVSDIYHEITGLQGAPSSENTPGNFMEWAYFHYGRYSFSTPGWWVPADKDLNHEVSFLKYALENIPDVFVPWTVISHPGFPGKKVEVGGIKPFSLNNPPASLLEDLISKNYRFIIKVGTMHPELEFSDLKTENAGENVFRVTLKVHNKGIFGTCSEAGENNMWTRIMRISLDTEEGQEILSGRKVTQIPRLEGDQSVEFSWLVMGKGTIKITAGAINTGLVTTSLKLNN